MLHREFGNHGRHGEGRLTDDDVARILEFWLGASGPDGALDPARRRMWFGDGRRFDDEIRARFGALHAHAVTGEFTDDCDRTPEGRLALIIVLDQFSRHIHRGTPAAFAQDAAAQRLALRGIELGLDAGLAPAARVFFYLPLEHAEDIALQRLSVERFAALPATVGPGWTREYEGFVDYARRHHDVIARFGRFPHRNAILGRASTPAESEFLEQPGSSF